MATQPSQESENDKGVVIPEEFQQAVHGVLKQATTKHHLNHIRDRVYAKEDEMRKEEQAAQEKGKKPNAKIQFTTDGGPVEPVSAK